MEQKTDSWKPGTPVEENACYWNEDPILKPATQEPDKTKPTVVDLFCGCGGFSTGFEFAGFESLAACDIHPPSIDTFAANHPTASMIVGDMRRVEDSMIHEAVRGHKVDVVAAGVPCQGFSLSNRKRHDDDDRNFLFKEFIRVVQILRPKAVVLENVSGLASSAKGAFKEAIAKAIEDNGYKVACEFLNAAEFGVPQRRRRLFFIGVSKELELRWPKPTHGPGNALPFVSVWDAIGDLPKLNAREQADEYDCDPSTQYQQFMRGKCNVIYNHIAPNHPPATIEKIKNTIPGKPIYPKFAQRIRLDPQGTSPTQVSGGIRAQYQFGHPYQPRGLTVRERCRIQSFPDRYQIFGGTVQGRVQTGNAVPPLLAKAVASQLLAAIKHQPLSGDSVPPRPVHLSLV